MSSSLVKAFQKALEAGVPLIGVNTADPGLTIRTLAQSIDTGITEQLESRDVAIVEGPAPRTSADGQPASSVYFLDPDGNLVELLAT